MSAVRLTRPLAVACAVLSLTLTGCGVAGTDFHPGVAAQVGDETVSADHVDEVATDYCTAIEDQIRTGGNPVPMRFLKSGIAGQLALLSAAEQLAEDYGVEPGEQYRTEVSAIEAQTEDLDEDVADAYLEINSISPYLVDVLRAVGAIELERDGQTDPSVEEQQAAGAEALEAWVEREGVELDPRYGMEFQEGQPVPVDTDVSFAVGDLAKAGQLSEPDADYTSTLPGELTCGQPK
jgi:hypothetical protein